MAIIHNSNMPREFKGEFKSKKIRVRHRANESLILNPITHIESKTKLHDETSFTVNKSTRNLKISPINMYSGQGSQNVLLTKQHVDKEDSIDHQEK